MRNPKLWWNLLILFILIPILIVLLFPLSAKAASNKHPSFKVTVSATIGEPKLTLFGYTSPKASVKLEGNRVAEETIADPQGYFIFDRIFLPPAKPNYPELCLLSVDLEKRLSFPTCLPPLPTGPFEITVGPILLPPTITIEKGIFQPNEQVVAEGLTIPNTEVTVFLANTGVKNNVLSISKLKDYLLPTAYAFFLPHYQIKSDQDGRFEFNLPAIQPDQWRLFAATSYLGSPSPKSNTLIFKVLGFWEWFLTRIVETLSVFAAVFKPYLWLIIILLEVVLLVLLIGKRTKKYKTVENLARSDSSSYPNHVKPPPPLSET